MLEIGKRRLAAVEPEITRNRVARDQSGALFVTGGTRKRVALPFSSAFSRSARNMRSANRVVDGAGEHSPIL